MEFFGNTKGSDHFDRHTLLVVGRLVSKNETLFYKGFAVPNIKYILFFIIMPIVVSLVYFFAFKELQAFTLTAISILYILFFSYLI